MRYLLFALGWLVWHIKAGFWYIGLAFRLFFAIGLDSNHQIKQGASDEEMAELFRYKAPRSYRKHLE